MRGRWYLSDEGTLRQSIDTDYHLIGKTLQYRTPVTCASKEGLCSSCYGNLFKQNMGINVGVNAALRISERNYQMVMSAKHSLNTNSDKVKFTPGFDDYFTLTDGFRVANRDDIEDVDNLQIRINKFLVKKDKEKEKEDQDGNEYIYEFDILNTETGEINTMKDEEGSSFYLSEQVLKSYNKLKKSKEYDEDGFVLIPMNKLSSEKDSFFLRLKNDELSRPLTFI